MRAFTISIRFPTTRAGRPPPRGESYLVQMGAGVPSTPAGRTVRYFYIAIELWVLVVLPSDCCQGECLQACLWWSSELWGTAAEKPLGPAGLSPAHSRDSFNNSKVPPSGVDHNPGVAESRGKQQPGSMIES